MPGKKAQDAEVARGEAVTLVFTVTAGAAATRADWYVAADRRTAAGDRDLVLSSADGGPVLVTVSGSDAVVRVPLTTAQTEALPVGVRHHELWITDSGGKPLKVAEGGLTVLDSLRN